MANNAWFTNPKSLSGLSGFSNAFSMPAMQTRPLPSGMGYTPTDPSRLPIVPPKPSMGPLPPGGSWNTPGNQTSPQNKPMQTAGPFSMGYNGPVKTGSFLGGGTNFGMGGPVNPVFGQGSSYDNWRQQFMTPYTPVRQAPNVGMGSVDTTSNAGGFYGSKGYFDFRGEPNRFKG